MTKRIVKTVVDNIPTELTITKSDFNLTLDKRIEIGDEFLKRVINTNDQLNTLKTDFSNWSDYNSEYLKHAFNKEFNEYKKVMMIQEILSALRVPAANHQRRN